MKPIKRPPGGFPWEAPGFSFQIDWPPGFVSQIRPDNDAEISARSTAARAIQVAKGNSGSICGLTRGADKLIAQYRENMKRGEA